MNGVLFLYAITKRNGAISAVYLGGATAMY